MVEGKENEGLDGGVHEWIQRKWDEGGVSFVGAQQVAFAH